MRNCASHPDPVTECGSLPQDIPRRPKVRSYGSGRVDTSQSGLYYETVRRDGKVVPLNPAVRVWGNPLVPVVQEGSFDL